MSVNTASSQSATVVVMGATGQQGGAVCRHALAAGWRVRAVTRSPQSAAAQQLQRQGAQVVAADMNDPSSLDPALQGADAVFSVQDFWGPGVGYDGEVRQGRHLAEAAKRAGVRHFVQSTMAQGQGGERVPHFASKHAIADHVRSLGLPWTLIGTVYFMDNFLNPKRGGAWSLPVLAGSLGLHRSIHMLAVDDLGVAVAQVIEQPTQHLHKQVDLASDILSVEQMRTIYREVTGKRAKRWAIPAWMFRRMNAEFAHQLAWQRDGGWTFTTEAIDALIPTRTRFAEFLRLHRITKL